MDTRLYSVTYSNGEVRTISHADLLDSVRRWECYDVIPRDFRDASPEAKLSLALAAEVEEIPRD